MNKYLLHDVIKLKAFRSHCTMKDFLNLKIMLSPVVSSSFKLVHASINADDAAAPAMLGQQQPVQNKDLDTAKP
jgi:hypothetical protein